MDFMKEYEKWLASPALSDAERAELESIRNDPKEIESRFYGPLEFGTAGLRGTMAVGLHNMNIHVIRRATQAFAQVICAEGRGGQAPGRGHLLWTAGTTPWSSPGRPPEVMRRQRHPRPDLRVPAPHAGADLRRAGVSLPARASTSPPATTPRSTTATRSTGRTAPSCPPTTPTPSPPRWSRSTSSTGIQRMDYRRGGEGRPHRH